MHTRLVAFALLSLGSACVVSEPIGGMDSQTTPAEQTCQQGGSLFSASLAVPSTMTGADYSVTLTCTVESIEVEDKTPMGSNSELHRIVNIDLSCEAEAGMLSVIMPSDEQLPLVSGQAITVEAEGQGLGFSSNQTVNVLSTAEGTTLFSYTRYASILPPEDVPAGATCMEAHADALDEFRAWLEPLGALPAEGGCGDGSIALSLMETLLDPGVVDTTAAGFRVLIDNATCHADEDGEQAISFHVGYWRAS